MSIKHTSVSSFGTCSRPCKLSRSYLLSAFLLCVIATTGRSQDNSGGYHLFNPVPRDQMREFSIDRPDVTESPNTVDAGHFQFEGDLIKWVKENSGESYRTISIFNGLYKMGLTKSWDIHLGIELYNIYQDPERKTYDKGYGSTTVRLKHNLWGNDGDKKTALGVIPYVSFPSSTQGGEEVYGVGFPFSFGITGELGGGAQFQFDFLPDGEGGRDLAYLQTFVVGGPMFDELDFYIEGAGYFMSETSLYFLNGGVIYNIGDNIKVDLATNLGVTDSSPTRVYLGFSFRI